MRIRKRVRPNHSMYEGVPTIALYLMAGYLYEVEGVAIMADSEFDNLCKYMDKHWDSIEHFHKHLVHRDSLASCTVSYIDWKTVPSRISSAAKKYYREYYNAA